MNSNRSFLAQFFSTPPITRALSILIIAVIVCVYIKLVSPYTLMYSPYFLKIGEIWRIFTCFLYFGNPSLDVLIHITFLYRYSRMLEEGFIYTSDYFWLVFIISSLLFFISNIFSIPLLASAFSSTITYIWTRKNPHAIVQIFGFISFPAFYLPFIVPLFMLVTEKKIMTEDLLGIVVGHMYFFFKDVYPKWGSDVFRTPCTIKKLFGEHTDECCKKPKYRTLNLNTTQPNPVMETIIIEDTINLNEDTINRNEDTINLNEETINTNTDTINTNTDTINTNTDTSNTDTINLNENTTNKSEDTIKSDLSEFSSHELSREKTEKEDITYDIPEKSFNIEENKCIKMNDNDKDWEEKWSSETIEDSDDS